MSKTLVKKDFPEIKIIYNFTQKIDLSNTDKDPSFNDIGKAERKKALEDWNTFIDSINDDTILKHIRRNKNGELSKVQPKSIYYCEVGELVTEFTNSYLAYHVRIEKTGDNEVTVSIDQSYFDFIF